MFAANHRMKDCALKLRDSLEQLKCDWVAVDLGGLGFGIEATVQDNTFQTLGYYRTCHLPHPSRAMHKPSVVQHILKDVKPGDILAYLDADIELRDTLSELETIPFDVGITVRPKTGNKSRLNAGVIFFRPSESTANLIRIWLNKSLSSNISFSSNFLILSLIASLTNSVLVM